MYDLLINYCTYYNRVVLTGPSSTSMCSKLELVVRVFKCGFRKASLLMIYLFLPVKSFCPDPDFSLLRRLYKSLKVCHF